MRAAHLALAAAVVALGCAADAGGHRHGLAQASVVKAGTQCGGEDAGPHARWISSQGALRAALGAGGVFGEPPPAPPVDFKKEGVLAVFMGQRPTAGYALALHDPAVVIADGVATVVVRFDEPPPGAITAQVLTSPCLLVRVPRKGLREVRVVDPAGTLRATALVPAQRRG